MGSKYSNKRFPGGKRRVGTKDVKMVIYIATEGITELLYFELECFTHPRIEIISIPTEGGRSDAKHVLDNLSNYKEQHEDEIEDGDQFWLVFDVDKKTIRNLSSVATDARKQGFSCAISNPCFELWLYLHHSKDKLKDKMTSQEMCKLHRAKTGDNKTRLKPDNYKDKIETAIKNAKARDHSDSGDRWPQKTGTHVYKLVEAIKEVINENK